MLKNQVCIPIRKYPYVNRKCTLHFGFHSMQNYAKDYIFCDVTVHEEEGDTKSRLSSGGGEAEHSNRAVESECYETRSGCRDN